MTYSYKHIKAQAPFMSNNMWINNIEYYRCLLRVHFVLVSSPNTIITGFNSTNIRNNRYKARYLAGVIGKFIYNYIYKLKLFNYFSFFFNRITNIKRIFTPQVGYFPNKKKIFFELKLKHIAMFFKKKIKNMIWSIFNDPLDRYYYYNNVFVDVSKRNIKKRGKLFRSNAGEIARIIYKILNKRRMPARKWKWKMRRKYKAYVDSTVIFNEKLQYKKFLAITQHRMNYLINSNYNLFIYKKWFENVNDSNAIDIHEYQPKMNVYNNNFIYFHIFHYFYLYLRKIKNSLLFKKYLNFLSTKIKNNTNNIILINNKYPLLKKYIHYKKLNKLINIGIPLKLLYEYHEYRLDRQEFLFYHFHKIYQRKKNLTLNHYMIKYNRYNINYNIITFEQKFINSTKINNITLYKKNNLNIYNMYNINLLNSKSSNIKLWSIFCLKPYIENKTYIRKKRSYHSIYRKKKKKLNYIYLKKKSNNILYNRILFKIIKNKRNLIFNQYYYKLKKILKKRIRYRRKNRAFFRRKKRKHIYFIRQLNKMRYENNNKYIIPKYLKYFISLLALNKKIKRDKKKKKTLLINKYKYNNKRKKNKLINNKYLKKNKNLLKNKFFYIKKYLSNYFYFKTLKKKYIKIIYKKKKKIYKIKKKKKIKINNIMKNIKIEKEKKKKRKMKRYKVMSFLIKRRMYFKKLKHLNFRRFIWRMNHHRFLSKRLIYKKKLFFKILFNNINIFKEMLFEKHIRFRLKKYDYIRDYTKLGFLIQFYYVSEKSKKEFINSLIINKKYYYDYYIITGNIYFKEFFSNIIRKTIKTD
jgi:hypothetical protein